MEDLNSGQLITRNIVHEIPVTDVVIKAVKIMVYYNQGFKSLKFKNRHGVIFHDADWIAGVDDNDNNKDKEDDDEGCIHEEAQDDQNQEECDEEEEQIDPCDKILSDARENNNPIIDEEELQPEQLNTAQDQEDTNIGIRPS